MHDLQKLHAPVGGEFGVGEGSSVVGIRHAYEGVKNVLRHYGMLPGEVTRVARERPTPPRLVRAPHLADYVPCPVSAIWEPVSATAIRAYW